MLKCISEIDCNKSSGGDIPAKIIKMANKELTVPITSYIKKCISSGNFPVELKTTDIIPVCKKQDVNDKLSTN